MQEPTTQNHEYEATRADSPTAGVGQPRGSATQLTYQQRFVNTAQLLTLVYLCAMLLGHPLVFSNFYFNITETKQIFFLATSGLYLLLLLFARIALPPDFGVEKERIRLHPAVIALFALFVVSVAGSLLSEYSGEAFFGENNRYQGLLTLFCYASLAFALSRRKIELRWPERAFLLGACIVSLLGLLHHFGIDPIGLAQDLRADDRGRFLSTIGNADFYASYIAMAFAAALGFFLRASKRARVFAASCLALVSFGVLVAGSDSAALGLLALFALAPLFLFADARAFQRLALGWGIFFLCAFFFGLLSASLPSVTYLSAFFAVLSRPILSLPLAAAAFALWFSLRRVSFERLKRLRTPYAIALAAAFLLAIFALVLLNTICKDVPLGALERYLRFSESWGTDRGKIWAFASRVYARMPWYQKLFGASSGALFHADAVNPLFSDAALDTAHNEYLQYLITNGALGLLSYLAALGFAIRAGIKRGKEEPVYRGLTLAVIVYAVQAAVNIAQPLTTPLFFVLIGVLISHRPDIARPLA